LTAAPWDFSVDTSRVQFSPASITFTGYKGTNSSSSSVQILIDNTPGGFPVLDAFDGGQPGFVGYDAKNLAAAALNNLYNVPAGDKPVDTFVNNGPGAWQSTTIAPYNGAAAMYCGQASSQYGTYEVDSLVSRKIKLGATSPTAVFYQHYN